MLKKSGSFSKTIVEQFNNSIRSTHRISTRNSVSVSAGIFLSGGKGIQNLFSGGISSFLAEYPRSLGGTLDENVLYLHIVNNI